ncbi:MAG TPA: sugar transferase [Gaiellaceae bacterium]
MTTGTTKERPVQADVRAAVPYILSLAPLKAVLRRVVSILALVTVDVGGLILGLYAALTLRALLVDPKPVLWGLLWNNETSWLAFLILLLVLVFWQAGLYAPRDVRESAGRVMRSVLLVTALTLAFAIGTGQYFETFGLYITAALFVSVLISVLRACYENATGTFMRVIGVRRHVVLVGEEVQRRRLRESIGSSRSGIDYSFVDEIEPDAAVDAMLEHAHLDELIIADAGLDEPRMLEIVEAAHRRGVKVRIAPPTTQLLIEHGEYVPGQGIPLFEVRPAILAGTDWVTKRSFDLVVGGLVAVIGLPVWLLIAVLIKMTSRGPVFYADPRAGLGEQTFRMLKFRTMYAGAHRHQGALEEHNEATGALFKIRDDPRVTPIGRILRRYSIDEVPNVINVLRGEMSLVGPRPLPLRDFELLEPWHRRRYNVLPGVTGLWQVGGRSDLSFDDLVRLDFYYLENWSIWLDVTILAKTPIAVLRRKGAY